VFYTIPAINTNYFLEEHGEFGLYNEKRLSFLCGRNRNFRIQLRYMSALKAVPFFHGEESGLRVSLFFNLTGRTRGKIWAPSKGIFFQ